MPTGPTDTQGVSAAPNHRPSMEKALAVPGRMGRISLPHRNLGIGGTPSAVRIEATPMLLARLSALYRLHFRDHRRERMFLASVCFLATFGLARAVTHWGRGRPDPFAIVIGNTHVHHLVWGVLLLLVVGYLWLIQVGTGVNGSSERLGRLTALLYGVGAALTLDEFALWLHLEDVYWERQGRASIDAVMLFGALVSAGLWGGPFLRATVGQLARLVRRAGRKAAAEPIEEIREPALEP